MKNGHHHTLRVSNLHRVVAAPPSPGNDDSLSAVSYDSNPPIDRKKRRSTNTRKSSNPSSTTRVSGNSSIVMNGIFQKLFLLLIVVVTFDIFFFRDAFGDIDSQGPEAGIHKLHDKNRIENALQSISSKLHAINAAKENNNNNNGDMSNNGLLSDQNKIIELQHEVEVWKGRYEMAIHRQQQSGGHDGSYVSGVEHDLISSDHDLLSNNNMYADLQFDEHELSIAELQEEKKHRAKNVEKYGVDDHIVKILTAANVEIDEELADQLPTWDDIVSMYGDEPIIHGLETCQIYRDTVKPEDRMLGPAGIFNTGTNLLFELMKANCNIKEARNVPNPDPSLPIMYREPRRNGMRWQPPWGKVRIQIYDVIAEYLCYKNSFQLFNSQISSNSLSITPQQHTGARMLQKYGGRVSRKQISFQWY
jgi:hypothetical protein